MSAVGSSRRCGVLALAVLLLACRDSTSSAPVEPASVPSTPAVDPAEHPPERTHDMSHGPFEIRLSPQGKGTLVNRSDQPQWVLHTLEIQASELRLDDPSRGTLEAFDTRSIKKFDNTVYREMFEPLAPGGVLELFELEQTRKGKAFELVWGPYQLEEVPKGTYSARVRWVSTIDQYLDEASGQLATLPGVWLGEIESPVIELRVR